jgi:hypothetical protein
MAPRASTPHFSPRASTPRVSRSVSPRISGQSRRFDASRQTGRAIVHQQRRIDRNRTVQGNVNRTRTVNGPSNSNRTIGNSSNRVRDASRNAKFANGKNGAIQRSVLRNQALAGVQGRNAASRQFANANFRGRFAASPNFHNHNWRWRHRAFVIGWFGPLFWPYAYDDFFDYTYWPYAYDTFWPYAYDDVYAGIFGPYAFASSAYANAPAYSGGGRPAVRVPNVGVAQVCSEQASELTQWPIDKIENAVQPDDNQRAALRELQDAAGKAVDILKAACPTDLPSTPTGRLSAMRQRLEAMTQAVAVVRPALGTFYDSLNDEQKERFNGLSPDENRQAAKDDLSRLCSGKAAAANFPAGKVRDSLKLNEDQSAALDALDDASKRASDLLQANCQADQSLTPTGRLDAMSARLKAMLAALDAVQPAMERFYSSLSDEQKARFNRLETRQG